MFLQFSFLESNLSSENHELLLQECSWNRLRRIAFIKLFNREISVLLFSSEMSSLYYFVSLKMALLPKIVILPLSVNKLFVKKYLLLSSVIRIIVSRKTKSVFLYKV